jgi:copper chaperone NosL
MSLPPRHHPAPLPPVRPGLSRRRFLRAAQQSFGAAALALSGVGCAKKSRCPTCGMVLDPTNRFATELHGAGGVVTTFDTPKCAFTALRQPGPFTSAELFARGYYTQTLLPAKALTFAQGSDVLGPMGLDFIPVEREHATRFAQEHTAKTMLEADAITAAVVRDLS